MKWMKQIGKTIEYYHLLEKGDAVIAAVSGGADSVFLLHALCALQKEYQLTLYAAHVNHGLRADTAQRDEAFVRALCEEKKIPLFVHHADVKKTAEEKKLSEEEAGRYVRYAFFEELQRTLPANKIATAHHKNDQAETVLMNLIRGSGLAGFGGISPKRGAIIRPLLSFTRQQIEAACTEEGISFVTDETNFQTKYTRNRIRLSLLPEIERYNPSFVDAAARNADILREEEEFLDDYVHTVFESAVMHTQNGYQVSIQALQEYHRAIRRRVIRRMAGDISAKLVEAVLALCERGQSGKFLVLPGNRTARIEYGQLMIEKRDLKKNSDFFYPLEMGKTHFITEAGLFIRAGLTDKPQAGRKDRAYFSLDKKQGLAVRSRKDGDVFYPHGMKGKKKLKEYFIDRKIPRELRGRIPLLVSDGDILWVIPMRTDRRYQRLEGECIEVEVWEENHEGD